MKTARQLVALKEAEADRSWAKERLLRRLVSERRIPFHKIGGRIYFDVADLDAFAEAARVESAATRSSRLRVASGGVRNATR